MIKNLHWVFANDFTAHEAAYLILGVDPSIDIDGRSASHIKKRMLDAYTASIKNLKLSLEVKKFSKNGGKTNFDNFFNYISLF